MVHRCGQKPSGEEVSFSLRYSRITDRLTSTPQFGQPSMVVELRLRVGITTLLFLKIRLYFVGNLSNFDKLLIINFVLACTYSNGQHDPLPPTAEAALLVQQRRHTIITNTDRGVNGTDTASTRSTQTKGWEQHNMYAPKPSYKTGRGRVR